MRMPLIRLAIFASALAGAAILTSSCSDESALDRLGSGCLLNSDCEEGLACVFERCHIQCQSSLDCPLASDGTQLRCVLGEKPSHVCQLEDDRDCAYHSECRGRQLCGPDGQCRDECLDDRDCVGGQVCLPEGICADPTELAGGELTPTMPPGGQSTGFPCAYDSQCEGLAPEGGPPFVCVDRGCNYGCFDNVDCEPGSVCEPDDGDASTPGACTPVGGGVLCIPGTQQACDCWPPGSQPGVQVCDADGGGFGVCTDADGMPCPVP